MDIARVGKFSSRAFTALSSMELGDSCWSIHFGKPHLANALDVAGTRAVGEAVEGVENSFVGSQFGDGETFK